MLNSNPELTSNFLVIQIIAPLRRSMEFRTIRLQTASLSGAIMMNLCRRRGRRRWEVLRIAD
ncbi:hypothetical protein HY78_28270 (plasmid) [Rhizorhabdus wittichii DC-6]|nr:hypothetical protein HY78_28270 [Rhizorhabdus wittichii DC-6]